RAAQSATAPARSCLPAFQLFDDRVDLGTKLGLTGDDPLDLGIELGDVDFFAGVFGLDVRSHRDVVVVLRNSVSVDKLSEILNAASLHVRIQDLVLMGNINLVFIALAHELIGGVDEQYFVIGLGLLQHDDARGDGRTEKQVRRQLDDGVDEIIVDQVLADLLFGSPAIQHTGELDDRGCAVDS